MAILLYILYFMFLVFVAIAFGFYGIDFIVSEDYFIGITLLVGSITAIIEIIKNIDKWINQ